MATWKSKVVVITGASSGIGEAMVRDFDAQGASVVLAARNLDKLEAIQKELSNESLIVQTDVSSEDSCKALIDSSLEKFGRIDALVNNAGISMRSMFKDLDLEVLKNLMNINFWGTVYCTKYALPELLKSKGHLVGISSIAGYRGLPGRTGYSASKFAMQGFLESIRTEHLFDGLHVLVCCPGYTATDIRKRALVSDGSAQGETPRDESKMMTAAEVAELTRKAMASRKRTLILTRQGKLTVFLNKWLPGWMDKMVYKAIAKEGGFNQ
jgi:short-subunit dehydrogenase